MKTRPTPSRPIRLATRRLLDPRESAEASSNPIADSVNIPLAELPERMHELPARADTVRVAGPSPTVAETVTWLKTNGRKAVADDGFRYGPPAPVGAIGRLWQPNAFLSEILPQLEPGTALDVACGSGRDAVDLAAGGWDVTGVDVLDDALDRARDLADRCAAAIRPIHWIQCDLESDAPKFGPRFDLITAFRFLHRPLFTRLRDWMRPGASLIYETFTALHRERHGKPRRDEFLLQPGELPTLVRGLEIRHSSEAWRGEVHTARIWATCGSG